jgi:hypothetical protein
MVELGEPLSQSGPGQGLDEIRICRPESSQGQVGAQGGTEQVRLVIEHGERLSCLPDIQRQGILVAQVVRATGGVERTGQHGEKR